MFLRDMNMTMKKRGMNIKQGLAKVMLLFLTGGMVSEAWIVIS